MRTTSVSLPFRPFTNILFVGFYTTVSDQIKAELPKEITLYTENKMENEFNLTLSCLHSYSYKFIATVEIHLEILKKPNTFKYDVSTPPPQLKLLHSHPLI
jgi:hypothetical protein